MKEGRASPPSESGESLRGREGPLGRLGLLYSENDSSLVEVEKEDTLEEVSESEVEAASPSTVVPVMVVLNEARGAPTAVSLDVLVFFAPAPEAARRR